MRNTILILCTAASLAVPTLAATGASAGACEEHAEHRRVAGTILGGLAGAVIGNQLARTKCYHRAYYARRPYEPAIYRPGERCGLRDQVYYDASGNPLHRQVQVCR